MSTAFFETLGRRRKKERKDKPKAEHRARAFTVHTWATSRCAGGEPWLTTSKSRFLSSLLLNDCTFGKSRIYYFLFYFLLRSFQCKRTRCIIWSVTDYKPRGNRLTLLSCCRQLLKSWTAGIKLTSKERSCHSR